MITRLPLNTLCQVYLRLFRRSKNVYAKNSDIPNTQSSVDHRSNVRVFRNSSADWFNNDWNLMIFKPESDCWIFMKFTSVLMLSWIYYPYSLAHCLNRINDISYPDSRYSLIHWNPLFCNFNCELYKNEIENADNFAFRQVLTRILLINPRPKPWVTVTNYKILCLSKSRLKDFW